MAKRKINGPGEWNGAPIKDMDYTHLCNTVRLLENQAKEKAEIAQSDAVQPEGTWYSEEWTENLREEYWDLLREKERREKEGLIHADLPNF